MLVGSGVGDFFLGGGGSLLCCFVFCFVGVRPEVCVPNVTDDSGLSIRGSPFDVLYRIYVMWQSIFSSHKDLS